MSLESLVAAITRRAIRLCAVDDAVVLLRHGDAFLTLAHERRLANSRAAASPGATGRAWREAIEERTAAAEPHKWYPQRAGRPDLVISQAQALVDGWRDRVEQVTNARNRNMLRVILGETLEQKRFFEQALAGRHDLLGRRGAQVGPSHGEVLSSRWIE